MKKRIPSGILVCLLLTSMFALPLGILPVRASGTVYIRADGSIDPPSVPIVSSDNVTYTFVGNVDGCIVVQRDNVVVDGAGYTLDASGNTAVDLSSRTNVTVKNMKIINFYMGVGLWGSATNCTIVGNYMVTDSLQSAFCVWLNHCSNNSIIGNNLISQAGPNEGGIGLYNNANSNIISGNNITACIQDGIWLYSSYNNRIVENYILNNSYGIWMEDAHSNNISCNILADNGNDIYLTSSTFNIISRNNASNSSNGIQITNLSSNNNISENTFMNDGVQVSLGSGYGNAMDGNVVNSKPLIFLEGVSGATVGDAGQVILVSCYNIKVENLNVSHTVVGVELFNTSNSEITSNNIKNNRNGIRTLDSSFNNITANNITANTGSGIFLYSSPQNTVRENNITDNFHGTLLWESSQNKFYHNNFINNTYQESNIWSYQAIWHDGYPSGGNYWSDYIGVDINSGLYQNETGSDGIGDTAYIINTNEKDNYPLMNPFGTVPYPPPPTYYLTIAASTGGTTIPAPGIYPHRNGTNVRVYSLPDMGYQLDHWVLDGSSSGSASSIDIPMNQNHTITAVFAHVIHQLTITATIGGTTNPIPGTYAYSEGSSVTVHATPSSDYILSYWELDSVNVGATNPISVTMDSNHDLRAVFASTYSAVIRAVCNTEGLDVGVSIWMDGSPTGYSTPHTFAGLTGAHTFSVSSADPSGHPFKQWSTGVSSTTIPVTSGGTYTAYYEAASPPPYSVTIKAHCNAEAADVSVSVWIDGIPLIYYTPHTFAGLTGSHTFTISDYDTSSHPFSQWSTGSTSLTITVDSGGTYTAYYEALARTLTVSSAHDSPSPSNGAHSYNDGQSVTCSVTSPMTEGSTVWTCTGWTGTGSVPPSGSGKTITFTITEDSSIIWNWQGQSLGNLKAIDIEAVQAVNNWVCGTVKLVQERPTTFTITYSSTFAEPKTGYIRIDLTGFDYSSWTFQTTFKPHGTYTLWLHNEDPLKAPVIKPRETSGTCKVTVDAFGDVAESNENDNTANSQQQYSIVKTKGLKVLFVKLNHVNEPDNKKIINTQLYQYMIASRDFLRATYPVDPYKITFEQSSERLLVPNDSWVNYVWILTRLNDMGSGYDRVVGVASDWTGWNKYWTGAGASNTNNKKSVLVKNIFPCTVAHEIGHTYGLDDDYRVENGQIVSVVGATCSGYWVMQGKPVTSAYSFMDAAIYINNQPSSNYWVEVSDYDFLLNKFAASDPEVVSVFGSISRNGTANFNERLYRISDGLIDLENTTGNYYVVLLDANGNVLSRTGFNVTFVCLSEPPVEVDEESFCFNVKWIDGIRMIQLLDAQGNVLSSKSESPSPPSVHVISPNGNETITPGMNYIITWSATDPDGDPLTFNVLIGNGIDSTPIPIATHISQTSFVYNFSNFAGGTQYLIYVLASDGVNVAEDVSTGFITVSGFTLDVVTTPQTILRGGEANYTIKVTSYGGFGGQVTLNVSLIAGNLNIRWIDGPTVTLTPDGSTMATLEVDAANATGGSYMMFVSGISGNETMMAMTSIYVEYHDVAALDFVLSKTVVGQGFNMTLNVIVLNEGSYSEEFSVCLYCNSTLIANQTVYLHAGTFTPFAFVWNTTGFVNGNYTISAYAWPVPNETDTADNTLIEGVVYVGIPGDLDANGIVDIFDLVKLALRFGEALPQPVPWPYPPEDINSDGALDIFDIVVVALHFGETG